MDSCFFHYCLTYNTSLITYFLKPYTRILTSLTIYSSCFTISPTYLLENGFFHLHNTVTSTFEALYPLKHPARYPWSHCLQNTLNTLLWKFLISKFPLPPSPVYPPHIINFSIWRNICSPRHLYTIMSHTYLIKPYFWEEPSAQSFRSHIL